MWVSFTGHPLGKVGSSISFRTSPMADSSDYPRDVGHIKSLNTNCTLPSSYSRISCSYRSVKPSCGFSGIQGRKILSWNQVLLRSGVVGCTWTSFLLGLERLPLSDLLPAQLICQQWNCLRSLQTCGLSPAHSRPFSPSLPPLSFL